MNEAVIGQMLGACGQSVAERARDRTCSSASEMIRLRKRVMIGLLIVKSENKSYSCGDY